MAVLGCSLAVVLSLLLATTWASRLMYVEKDSGASSAEVVAKLTKIFDIRGDYGNFVLVVDHDESTQGEGEGDARIVFGDFDTVRNSYFVLEHANLDYVPILEDSIIFQEYASVVVKNKYIFEVDKSTEDIFVVSVPSYLELVWVPEAPLPAPVTDEIHLFSIPSAPDPYIANLIGLVDKIELRNFVTYLSGETSTLITRQSQSTGAATAANWLGQQFTSFGFSVTTQAFRAGYSPNVVATLPGKVEPNKLVLVTAHYDSRGPSSTSTTARAPGANDNGSGSGALLEIAKRIYTSKVSFGYTVILTAFGGEEQGLYGSAYAAQQYKTQGANIIAVLNADMIAYHSPSEPAQLAFVLRSSTLSLNNILSNISALYVPALTLGTTTACCTDHSSFYNQGFPATSFFERNGAIADPQYHKEGDLVFRTGYDVEFQYPAIVQAIYASLLTIAQFQL